MALDDKRKKNTPNSGRDAAENPDKPKRDSYPAKTEREIDNLPGAGGSAEIR